MLEASQPKGETMADYSAEVAELEAAYRANRVTSASIATDVRAKYRAIIQDEIRERKRENDINFAKHLARVKERSGMPLSVIQDHVLHTKSWDRWVYWRDLAGIEPERVSVRAVKAEKARQGDGLVWSEDYKTLTFTHDGKGNPLIRPVVLPTDPAKKGRNGYRGDLPDKATDPEGFEAWADLMDTFPGGIVDFYRKMSDEIEKQAAAGNVEVEEVRF